MKQNHHKIILIVLVFILPFFIVKQANGKSAIYWIHDSDVKFCNPKKEFCIYQTPNGVTVREKGKCPGTDCMQSFAYIDKNDLITIFLGTFNSGDYNWSQKGEDLVNITLDSELNKLKYSKINTATIYSHTDYQDVKESAIFPADVPCDKKDNACLRKNRRKTTSGLTERLINQNVTIKQLTSKSFDIKMGVDNESILQTNKINFNGNLLEKINAKDVEKKACDYIKTHGYISCNPADFVRAFRDENLQKTMQEIFKPYRNAIVVVDFEK
ncbi:MAG TPA: hypothetical protein VJL89_08005 [Thermodesulfovibrionia bacterium]|nr:hypothetical protein [Thermodesulfovibrionia bacterium]